MKEIYKVKDKTTGKFIGNITNPKKSMWQNRKSLETSIKSPNRNPYAGMYKGDVNNLEIVDFVLIEKEQLKSEQNKVAVEKLEELRARFDNSPIIFFHDTELNEKERAIIRDEYEDAKFIFRDNIDQLLAELKGESDE